MNRPHEKRPEGEIVYGLHPVREAIYNPARRCHELWVSENALSRLGGLPKTLRYQVKERKALDRVAGKDAVHQGVVLFCDPLEEMFLSDLIIKAAQSKKPQCLVILDQVTDPHNVGAILRSACAFGALGILQQSRHSPEMTPVLLKSAAGAGEHIPLVNVTNISRAIEELKDNGFHVAGLDEGGVLLTQHTLGSDQHVALVMGAEGRGMRPKVKESCSQLYRLPTSGPVGTLNVSNAAAVALYAFSAR